MFAPEAADCCRSFKEGRQAQGLVIVDEPDGPSGGALVGGIAVMKLCIGEGYHLLPLVINNVSDLNLRSCLFVEMRRARYPERKSTG